MMSGAELPVYAEDGGVFVRRQQFSPRAPKMLLDKVREQAKAYGMSMNDFVVAAVQKEVDRSEQSFLLADLQRTRRKLESRGIQPDSTEIIRELRERGGWDE